MARRVRIPFVALACIAMNVVSAPAQTTATVLGTVTDTSGGVLPGVTVTVRNAATGLTRTAVTDAAGRYREPQLPLGQIDIEAQIEGFQPQLRKGIVLTVGAELVVNFSLGVGSIEETLVVSGEAPIVQTTSAEMGALVDSKMISQMPLNARDVQQLGLLQAGVQQQKYNGYGTQMVVSGTRPENNRFLLNGVDMTGTASASPVGASDIMMGVEGVQEFKLLTSGYSAAFGEKAGGVMNLVTKSGTNAFHGSAYEYYRNDRFDAPNYFDQAGTPPFNRHQFGASFGGRIRRDRTFFFTNYEQFRQRLGLSRVAVVPSARARQGYLPGPGGEIFVGVAPQVVPYLALYPPPNGRTFADGTAEFFSNPTQPVDERYVTLRVDHALTGSDTLSGIFTGDWSDTLTPGSNSYFAEHITIDKKILSVQNVHIFGPALVNTTRFGLNVHWFFSRIDPLVPIDPSIYFVPNAFNSPSEVGQVGYISVTGLAGIALEAAAPSPRWFKSTTPSISSDFNYTRGAHSWQFGGVWKHVSDDGGTGNPISRGQYVFSSLQNFLQGRPNTFAAYPPGQDQFRRNWLNTIVGAYVEDSIRLRENLTFTPGLRYETVFGPKEEEGRISNLRGGPLDPAPTVGEPYFLMPRGTFAPRLALNWDVAGDGKSSLRGAAGVFRSLINTYYVHSGPGGNIPFARAVQILNPPFPNGYSVLSSTSIPNFVGIDYNANVPTKYSYNVTFQREIGGRMAVAASYVGSQSRWLGRNVLADENIFIPTVLPDGTLYWPPGLTRPNPNFGTIGLLHFDANSSYDGVVLSVERRAGGRFSFTGNYTGSKCVDDISDEYSGATTNGGGTSQYVRDRRSSRGPCAFNNTHSLNVTTTLELPGENLPGGIGKVLGGWRWSAITTFQTGVPFDVSTGFNNSRKQPTTAPMGDLPNFAPGCDAKSAILGGPDQYFNPMCFELPPPGYLGTMGSRVLTGPGFFTSDWSFAKTIPLGSSRRIELRADVFNVTNHDNFAVPSSVNLFLSNRTRIASAGKITRTIGSSRQMQFGIKFSF